MKNFSFHHSMLPTDQHFTEQVLNFYLVKRNTVTIKTSISVNCSSIFKHHALFYFFFTFHVIYIAYVECYIAKFKLKSHKLSINQSSIQPACIRIIMAVKEGCKKQWELVYVVSTGGPSRGPSSCPEFWEIG